MRLLTYSFASPDSEMNFERHQKRKPTETLVVTEVQRTEDSAESKVAECTLPQETPVLGARYDVLDFVGSGGMGTVWKVYDKELKETFAIKVLKPELLADDVSLKRFQQEARLATDLTHANIAAIFGPGEDTEGRPYIIMRYVEGESLADILKREGKLEPERAMDIFWQIHAALTHSHMKGIIHRDIKPSNIIISRTESGGDMVNIIDFGIAKSIYEEVSKTQALTKAIDVFGSPQYMSPEQLLGKEVGPASDFYSLGCVLHEMFTGNPPFQSDNPVELLVLQLNETADLSGIPAQYAETLGICLEKAPLNRIFLEASKNKQTAGHIPTHLEHDRELKYAAALIPILITCTAIAGLKPDIELIVFRLPLIQISITSIGLLWFSLSDTQALQSRTFKEVAAAWLVGCTSALIAGTISIALQICSPSTFNFPVVIIVSVFVAVLTANLVGRTDLQKLHDLIMRFLNNFGTKNPIAHRAMTGKFQKLSERAFQVFVHVFALLFGVICTIPILMPPPPDFLPVLLFCFLVGALVSLLNKLAHSYSLFSMQRNLQVNLGDSSFHYLKLVTIYTLAVFACLEIGIPNTYLQNKKITDSFYIAKTEGARSILIDKIIGLPHSLFDDYARLSIATATKRAAAVTDRERQLLEQIISNTSYTYSPLKADALVTLAWKTKDHSLRSDLAKRAFDLLENPGTTSINDVRESLLIEKLLPTMPILVSIADLSVEEGDVKLAQHISQYVDKIPDSKKYEYQRKFFSGIVKNAKERAEAQPTAPAPQSPSQ